MNWISVKEKQPEEEEFVLVWLDCDFISIGYVREGEWCFQTEIVWFSVDANEGEVTHWMPLPAPPWDDQSELVVQGWESNSGHDLQTSG